jgi:hypothetical protein
MRTSQVFLQQFSRHFPSTKSPQSFNLIPNQFQSMVDELLNQKNGFDINNIQALAPDYQLDYIKRDDNSIGRMSESTSDGSINSLVSCPFSTSHQFSSNSQISRQNEMKSITKKNDTKPKKKISTSVFFKNGKEAVQNEAFENIGDEDL